MRRQRRLHVVALLTELKHGALIGRRRVVPAVIVGDALAALRALMREVRHDEIVSHVLNRDAQFLGELRVEVIANLRVGQLLPACLALRRRFLTLVLLGVLRLFLFDPRDPILGDAGEVIPVKVRKFGGAGDVVVLVTQAQSRPLTHSFACVRSTGTEEALNRGMCTRCSTRVIQTVAVRGLKHSLIYL